MTPAAPAFMIAPWIPLAPLLGWAVLGLAGGRIGRRGTAWIACSAVAASFLAALALQRLLAALPPQDRLVTVDLYRWIATGSVDVPFRLLVDPLSVAVALVVGGVGLLIHVYSAGYMADDAGLARYFAYLNLFVAAMLLLVLSGNLVVMFIGWEGVGLASYLLIAFWFERPAAARAGVKAFIVTRLGDVGFLIGILLAFSLFGTADFTAITLIGAGRLPAGGLAVTALALLLFLGAAGKSAQGPLYVWLPDAMEGPTPVSALIHAATMVTAGVYMIVRLHAVYARAPLAMDTVAAVGAITAIFAASAALVETDLKRVLAYSTISQLGYMFLAVGVGAWSAGIFHLTTHAFFKALLFLAAGAVMHALGGETDMRRMGGLRGRLPRTTAAFAIGALALAGIPPLAGFVSKDLILSEVFRGGHVWWWLVGLAAAGLTAFYIVRAYALVFAGAECPGGHSAPADHAGGDPPPVMARPIFIFAALSITGGLLGSLASAGVLGAWLGPVVQAGITHTGPGFPAVGQARPGAGWSEAALVTVSVAVALAGVILAWLVYVRRTIHGQAPAVARILARRFYVEDVYDAAVVNPSRVLARGAATVDRGEIDAAVTGAARAIGRGGGTLRRAQTGYLRHYAVLALAGALILMGYWVWR